jgi:hypothetical protein
MTPLEQRVKDLEKLVQTLVRVENVEFIKNAERRLNFLSGSFRLSDASDVSSTAPGSGQVLEWNGSEWAPATDNVV